MALLLAVAEPAAPQPVPQAPAITRQQALELPPGEVADIVFRQLGARMTELERPTYVGRDDPNSLWWLSFATTPRSAHDHGLCEATVVTVHLEPEQARAGGSPAAAARASGVETSIVYKVVGALDPGVGLTTGQEAQLARSCAQAGPVIPSNGGLGQHVFFSFRGAPQPWLALRALARAIRGARDATYTDIGCNSHQRPELLSACRRDPRLAVGGLDPANLSELEIAPTGHDADHYRIVATFLISAEGNTEWQWLLTLDAHIHVSNDARTVTVRLGPATVGRGQAFYD